MSTPHEILLDSFGGSAFGSSWRFREHLETLTATVPEEVAGVLAAVQDAAASGLYAAGFVAYEAASALNPDLPSLPPAEGLPLVRFALYRERVAVEAGAGLPAMATDALPLAPSVSPEAYAAGIGLIREYIAAGDCYQINQTFPLRGSFNGDPLALYHRIGHRQRAPFCAYLDTGRFVILSASPELFFSLKDGIITTRPMKGTARRGRWAAEDRAAAEQLRQSPKERAENLMIVDLLRNDLGIVAETGSVKADHLFRVETYPTVHQMTSTVTARLNSTKGLADIFQALFPCGSVTGAPKRRSMEIIAGIEQRPRGVYCGAIGYIAPGGEALFSVAIRTLLLDRRTGAISLGVGSGVTWDSNSQQEYNECLSKAGFLTAAENDFQLIESLRLEDGDYTLLERHLQRLGASADYFGFVFEQEQVRKQLAGYAARKPGLHKVRLLLAANGCVTISSELLTEHLEPLRIGISEVRADSGDAFRYHKTTRRAVLDSARASRPDCDEVLLLNERGELAEGSYHTLVVKLDNRLLTPPLTSGLLPGVLREELLERHELSEQVLFPGDLRRAEELWLINSVRGWRRGVLV